MKQLWNDHNKWKMNNDEMSDDEEEVYEIDKIKLKSLDSSRNISRILLNSFWSIVNTVWNTKLTI